MNPMTDTQWFTCPEDEATDEHNRRVRRIEGIKAGVKRAQANPGKWVEGYDFKTVQLAGSFIRAVQQGYAWQTYIPVPGLDAERLFNKVYLIWRACTQCKRTCCPPYQEQCEEAADCCYWVCRD